MIPVDQAAEAYSRDTGVELLLPSTEDLLDLLPPDGSSYESACELYSWVEKLDYVDREELTIPISDVRLLVPIASPPKMLFLAGNYAKHVAERGGAAAERDETFPYVFMKPPSTTLTHPGDPIVIPRVSPDQIDWECELGVVIGRRCRHVDEDEAMALHRRLHGRERHQRPRVQAQPQAQAARARQVLRLAARQVARHVLPDGPVHPVGRRGAGPAGAADQAHGQRSGEARRLHGGDGLPGGGDRGVPFRAGDASAGRRDRDGHPIGRRLGDRDISQARRLWCARPSARSARSRTPSKPRKTKTFDDLSFRKLMVANRGEIAIRVFRSSHELGIRTVAIYSHEDRFAIHRSKADEAYEVGKPGEPIRSYLNIEAIVELAKAKEVDAIHPGLRLPLGECRVRPGLRGGGHRVRRPAAGAARPAWATRWPREAGAGGGHSGALGQRHAGRCRAGGAASWPSRSGYPVIVKASMGGGGRGMRVVESAEELDAALDQARREAGTAFGVPDVFIEKFIRKAKHIEVQILGDQHGNLVHLYERDCSVQRRHQKIVEIAPAHNLDPAVRAVDLRRRGHARAPRAL